MWRRLLERSWKGFVTRYLMILLVLLAINYAYMNSEKLFPADTAADQERDVQLNVDYELVGDELHLVFQLTNFELSLENMDQDPQPNQGHIHLYLNGEKMTKIFEPNYVYRGLEQGKHVVKIELAHNNHEPIGIEEEFLINVEESTETKDES